MPAKVPSTPESLSARGRYAACYRDLGPDHPTTRQAREIFAAERYLAGVAAAVSNTPPLDPERRYRLGQILASVETEHLAVSA